MKKTSVLVLSLAALGLIGPALSAQELTFGAQATLSLPTGDVGDFVDKELGYGLGAHMLIGFQGGHAIVPRVDYTYFEKSDWDAKVKMLQVGVDYDYYFSGRVNQGLYAGVGVGYGSAKFETRGADDTPDAFTWGVNVGYQFTRHLGVELRFTDAKYQPEFYGNKSDIKAPTANASFVYRF